MAGHRSGLRPTMAHMDAPRVAMAQINPTVGAVADNAQRVRSHAQRAASQGAGVVLFGEMALTGYPVEDLALRRSFREAVARQAQQLAEGPQRDGLGERSGL